MVFRPVFGGFMTDYTTIWSCWISRWGLFQVLNRREDALNTAVTICSDHGELLGVGALKGCFLEGAIRPYLGCPLGDVEDYVVYGVPVVAYGLGICGPPTMRCRGPTMAALVHLRRCQAGDGCLWRQEIMLCEPGSPRDAW